MQASKRQRARAGARRLPLPLFLPRTSLFWYWAQHHSTSQPDDNFSFTLSQGRLKAPIMCKPSAWNIVMDYIFQGLFFFNIPQINCTLPAQRRELRGTRYRWVQLRRAAKVNKEGSHLSSAGAGGRHCCSREAARWSRKQQVLTTQLDCGALPQVDFQEDPLMKKWTGGCWIPWSYYRLLEAAIRRNITVCFPCSYTSAGIRYWTVDLTKADVPSGH